MDSCRLCSGRVHRVVPLVFGVSTVNGERDTLGHGITSVINPLGAMNWGNGITSDRHTIHRAMLATAFVILCMLQSWQDASCAQQLECLSICGNYVAV